VGKILDHQPEIELNEEYLLDDAEIAVITFGSPGRAAREAINRARAKGIKVGMFRVITFWPFPVETVRQLVDRVSACIVPEMNMGMLRLQVEKSAMRRDVQLTGINVVGGVAISPQQILDVIEKAHQSIR
jgi:2-oxoglutarate ferredoxin oxidoreductase subunit alpha